MTDDKSVGAKPPRGKGSSSQEGKNGAAKPPKASAGRSAENKKAVPKKVGAKAAKALPQSKTRNNSVHRSSQKASTTSPDVKKRRKDHHADLKAKKAKAAAKAKRQDQKASQGQIAFRELVTFDVRHPDRSFEALRDWRVPRELWIQSRKARQQLVVTAYAQYAAFVMHLSPDEFAKHIRQTNTSAAHPSRNPLHAFLRCIIDYDGAWNRITDPDEQKDERLRTLKTVARDAAVILYLVKKKVLPEKALALAKNGKISLDLWARRHADMQRAEKQKANTGSRDAPGEDDTVTPSADRKRDDEDEDDEDLSAGSDDEDDDTTVSSKEDHLKTSSEEERDAIDEIERLKKQNGRLKKRLRLQDPPEVWSAVGRHKIRGGLLICNDDRKVVGIINLGRLANRPNINDVVEYMMGVKRTLETGGSSSLLLEIPDKWK